MNIIEGVDTSQNTSMTQTESSFLHLIQQFEQDAKQLGILSPNKHLITPTGIDRRRSKLEKENSSSDMKRAKPPTSESAVNRIVKMENNDPESFSKEQKDVAKNSSLSPTESHMDTNRNITSHSQVSQALNFNIKSQGNFKPSLLVRQKEIISDVFSESTTDFNEDAKANDAQINAEWLDVSAISSATGTTTRSETVTVNGGIDELALNNGQKSDELNQRRESITMVKPPIVRSTSPTNGGAKVEGIISPSNSHRHSYSDQAQMTTIIDTEFRRASLGAHTSKSKPSNTNTFIPASKEAFDSNTTKKYNTMENNSDSNFSIKASDMFDKKESPQQTRLSLGRKRATGRQSVKEEELSNISIESHGHDNKKDIQYQSVNLFSPSRGKSPKRTPSKSSPQLSRKILTSINTNIDSPIMRDLTLTIDRFKNPITFIPSSSLINERSKSPKLNEELNQSSHPTNDSKILELRNANLEKIIQNLKYDHQQQEKLAIHYEKAFENEKELTKRLNQQLGESVEKIANLSKQLAELRLQQESSLEQMQSKERQFQQELQRAKENVRNENNNLRTENSTLQNEINGMREKVSDLQNRIHNLEMDISQKNTQLQEIKNENGHLQSVVSKQTEHVDSISNKLTETQSRLRSVQGQKHSLDATLQDIKLSIHSETISYKEKLHNLQKEVQDLQNANKSLEIENDRLYQEKENLEVMYTNRISQLKHNEVQLQESINEMREINRKLDINKMNMNKKIDTLLQENEKLSESLTQLRQTPQNQDQISVSRSKFDVWKKTKRFQDQKLLDLQHELKAKQQLEHEMRLEIQSLNEENQSLRRTILDIDNRYSDQQQSLLNHSSTNLQTIQARYNSFVSKYEELVTKYRTLKQKNKKYKGKYTNIKKEFNEMKKEQNQLRTQIEILMEKEV